MDFQEHMQPSKESSTGRHERRYQKALQNMCNMYTTQVRECQIREENLQTIATTHGFHMYGFDR